MPSNTIRTASRTLTAVALAVCAVAGGVAAAPAGANPPPKPIPRFSPDGEAMGLVGDHDFCRGIAFVDFSAPKRAVTRVTITSRGFTGNGPGWARNPRCKVDFAFGYYSAIALGKSATLSASFGPRPGEKVTRDIVTGSGLVLASVIPTNPKAPAALPTGLPVLSSYLVVP